MNNIQRSRIQSLLNAEITVKTFRQRIKAVRDPIELHQLAFLSCDTAVWHDEGFEWPQSVADHPYCDAGTALMLYWMDSPEHVYAFGNCDDSDENEVAHLEYLKSIEDSYLHEAYRTSKIRFDPRMSLSNKKNVDKYRWIPCGMFIPSPGKAVSLLKWKRDDDYNVILR